MSKRSWTKVAALLGGAAVLVWALGVYPAKAPAASKKDKAAAKEKGKDGQKELPARETSGKDVFGLTKVHDLHLEISAKEWEKMQAVTGGMRFPGGPGGFGGPQRPEKPAEKPADVHKGNGFGMEFPWAHGQLTEDGRTYKDLGLRYKGNASYMMSARGLKRNFKIDFDRYHEDQRYHGLKTINLNAGAMDPTKAREALSFAVFRAAGVPAPRTSYARVTLTVPGKYDKELLGLYTLIEQVDRTFLKDHFKNGKGLLMKPEGLRGIEYLGDDWGPYKARYKPKHEPSKKEAQRLIDFARLVNKADDKQFQKEITSYLDVDEFLRFVAVNALLANLDSMFMIGHNYYIYLNPETNKFVFIPWDMDLSLAGFPMMGSPEQQLDLSLTHPYAGANRLIDRLLAMKDVSVHYQKLLGELAVTCFTKEQLLKDVEAIGKATKEILARETKAAQARKEGTGGIGFGPPGGGPFGRSPDLKTFVEKRTSSVVAQLSGKSKGYVPVMGFGMGNFMARPVLEALDADKDGKVSKDELLAAVKKFFKDCDKDKKGKLDEQALAAGLNRLFPPPPDFGPPGGGRGGPGGRPGGPGGPGGRPGGPGGFGPGTFLASAILKRADTDKDGKVTLDELIAAAEALFKQVDKDKKGKLDEQAIAAGIDLLSPRPGAGPGGPGGFGMGNFLAKPVLDALDTDKDGKVSKDELVAATKKLFKDWDQDKKGKLDEQALAAGLNRLFPAPPGGGPGGPGGRPGGFGPGTALASAIVKRADTDKDGKVTLDELVAAAEALFKEIDKDKKGKLDENALAAGINLLLPRPGFGPGGPGGPGDRFRPGGPAGPGGGFGPPPGGRPSERKLNKKRSS